MAQVEEAGRRVRHWRSISEKRQIVELTLEPGASVAEVARAHGVNANQVFKWRRAFDRGELSEPCALLPVSVSATSEITNQVVDALSEAPSPGSGSIHIELHGWATISAESGADPILLRAVLESLRK